MIANLEQIQRETENGLGIFPMPADAYHADHTAVNKSALSMLRKRPRLYQATYITHTAPVEKPSAKMDLGTLAHAGLLEPDKLSDLFAIYPSDILASNGAASTKAAKAFADEQEALGRVVLKQADFDCVLAMIASVKRVVGDWFKHPSRKEHAVYWEDKETGLRCKCRPDWLIETGKTAFILDLKTTADVSPFAFRKQCENFDYWLQRAHYSAGVASTTGLDTEFYLIAVESEFPYSCAMYRLDGESAVQSERAWARLMAELRTRLDTGNWADPWEQEITPLEIRKWCFDPSNTP